MCASTFETPFTGEVDNLIVPEAPSISGNEVVASLECKENNPPPAGGGNTAAKKEGQCRNL